VLLPGFLEKATCEHIINLAEDYLEPSEVVRVPGQTAGVKPRTSYSTSLNRLDDPSGLLAKVEDKIARFSLLPSSHFEVGTLRLTYHMIVMYL
jgi:hypothetical protein